MFRSFKLSVSDVELDSLSDLNEHRPMPRTISEEEMLQSVESRNANWILDNWFKEYGADVFLSHSSVDGDRARKVAGVLSALGLNVFIDSELWGRVECLQRKIDDKYAVLKETNGVVEVYNYNKRNITTGHTHVLLTYALTRMINATECFIFLSTPQSVVSCTEATLDTYSPWLFHELEMVNVIEPQEPKRRRFLVESIAEDASVKAAQENFSLKFCADTRRLKVIGLKDLLAVRARYLNGHSSSGWGPQACLDMLYNI